MAADKSPDVERARAEVRFIEETWQSSHAHGNNTAVPDQVRLQIAIVSALLAIEKRLAAIEKGFAVDL